ncbi:hypothetical protein BC962_2045 [Gillisia mitskevichiae]|uniref:Uracil DNA glycosylase superfamily protein n=1 Tax=Gillisia mitskevichiae TaxID=270921 RepID=A0A495PY43_9FLAO|nr:hypothetical protein [Gillisia mitskevichiae]RKS53789.1 hypothetical protein BC962_2045 [Gillisia mitskevichiae]
MIKIISDYSAITEEIKKYHSLILKECENNPRINEIYKGCQILYSPLLERPEFLLIGFNPGGGHHKWHGKIVEQFDPMTALEYYLNKHSLGEQTKTLFTMAGKEDELRNSTVKFNFYPWATNNVADFNELMRLLPKNLRSKLFALGRVWTKTIIEIVKPSTIICEGFKAFDEVQILFPEKLKIIKEENLRSFQDTRGIKVLAYKRNQGSIVNKQNMSEHIKINFLVNHK